MKKGDITQLQSKNIKLQITGHDRDCNLMTYPIMQLISGRLLSLRQTQVKFSSWFCDFQLFISFILL